MKKIALTLCLTLTHIFALDIYSKPILFDTTRIALTKEYIQEHYDLHVNDITITPKIIVLHYTASNDFQKSFERFYSPTLSSDRVDIVKASNLNVSAHFLVDFDGKIYQLMPDNFMARHVIGLNYSSIGIENVGTLNTLSDAQVTANVALIKYLQHKYPSISKVIAHSEYRSFENNTTLWREKNAAYRTTKQDPGATFMKQVRARLQ